MNQSLEDLLPHARALLGMMLAHVLCIGLLWRLAFTNRESEWITYLGWGVMVIYPASIATAFVIQRRLKALGYVRSGAWQVLVGAVILNPCFLGWWIAASVCVAYWAALSTERQKREAAARRPAIS